MTKQPPAYQEYAANILADISFRISNLSERGLLYTLRLECWVNGSVPADHLKLSKILGLSFDEVETALTENVLRFFEKRDDKLICPELDEYKKKLNDARRKQSEGGKKGARKTNSKMKNTVSDVASTPSGNSQLPRQAPNESLIQNRIAQSSTTQSLDSSDIHREWLRDYEGHSRDINGF